MCGNSLSLGVFCVSVGILGRKRVYICDLYRCISCRRCVFSMDTLFFLGNISICPGFLVNVSVNAGCTGLPRGLYTPGPPITGLFWSFFLILFGYICGPSGLLGLRPAYFLLVGDRWTVIQGILFVNVHGKR